MKLIGNVKVLNLKNKSFKNDKDEEIKFTAVSFCDDEGNKFDATVPKDVTLSLTENSDFPVDGKATFNISTRTSKVAGAYPKFNLMQFEI